MALQTTQNFNFPSKGINRVVARSNQPADSVWDMLNILPFDGTGRLRGGKRRGTSKVWATPLGVSTDSIVLTDQVTLVGPASSGSTAIFTDHFSYPDDGMGNELHNASGGVWNVFDEALGTTSTEVTVLGTTKAMLPQSTDGAFIIPAVTPTVDLEGGYSVECNASLILSNGSAVGIAIETDETDWYIAGPVFSAGISTDGSTFTLTFSPRGSTFTPGVDYFTGDVTGAGPGLVQNNSVFAFKLVVSAGTGASRKVQVFINGAQVGGFDCPIPAKDTHTNFLFTMASTDVSLPTTIDDIIISSVGVDSGGVPVRSTKLVCVANRDVYMGDINTQGTLVTSGTNAIAAHVIPQGCYSAGKYYFVDGSGKPKQLDLATAAMESFTETAGTAPSDCTVCCIWRDRLVLAGPDQNVYFSRVGDHHDFNYGATDPAAAFSANSSENGHIGEPVVSLMPLGDDLLGIGGDHNLWVARGDPAAGGSFDEVSNAIGVFSAKSWARSPDGTVYFVGTGGLYRWTPNSRQNPLPECISLGNYNQFFTALDRSRIIPSLSWDRDKHGLWCFMYRTGADIEGAPVHLWYDERFDALFPLQLPIDQGPICSLVYDGDLPDDRVLLLAGRDGYLRKLDDAVLSDDSTAINAYMDFGPFALGDANNDGIIGRVNITLGEPDGSFTESDFSVTVTVRGGDSAYDATEGTTAAFYRTATRTFAGQYGRLTPIRERLRGAFGAIRLADNSADKTFSFEMMSVDTEASGLTRR